LRDDQRRSGVRISRKIKAVYRKIQINARNTGRFLSLKFILPWHLFILRIRELISLCWRPCLGGNTDATNAVNSLVAAITPISYEHTQKLGEYIERDSNRESRDYKNFKDRGDLRAARKKRAIGVIRERCKNSGAELFEVGEADKL